ncbi:MAG TPA: hypothetical protein VFJ94_16180 [Intrasporangium sp.]|uniref:hypothetical protein n=1 Tax=Intrasporangium sp. TaxID=1925024 RepID=UPI002D76BE7F|nr:hypothetical protein [Intrasporangium sp.]HET7400055.1 hypothetical protein [Intrasporangium sp.]
MGLLATVALVAPGSPSSVSNASAVPVGQNAAAGTVRVTATVDGRVTSARAATATDRAKAAAESTRRPFAGPRPAAATVSDPTAGVASTAITAPAPNAVGDLTVFRNTAVPTSGNTSTVSEPSTDQSGKDIFQTSNWTSQYSHNNGATWTSLNPFTIFGAGFCCDQVTIKDTGRSRQFWLLQYGDHLTLASSATTNLATWCTYTLTPQAILGRPAGEQFDYNDLAVGTRFLYLTSNLFSAAGSFTGTAFVRFNLDNLAACQAAGFNQVVRTDLFTLKVADGSTDIAYAASTNLDAGTGTTLRILTWPENSTVVTTTNKTIAAFTYMSNGTGNCASANGVVNNWCQRTDSRISGAARGDGKIRFSFNVRQTGTARPFPYTRMETFRESDLALLANQDLFGTTVAHLYVSLAPDRRGHIGYVDTFGGGTGTNSFFPGVLLGLVDDFAPNFPGSTSFAVFGSGAGCLNPDGLRRWGDYNTARGGDTGAGSWTVTSWIRTTNTNVGCGTATPVSIRNIVFGRGRDQASYLRFYNK